MKALEGKIKFPLDELSKNTYLHGCLIVLLLNIDVIVLTSSLIH